MITDQSLGHHVAIFYEQLRIIQTFSPATCSMQPLRILTLMLAHIRRATSTSCCVIQCSVAAVRCAFSDLAKVSALPRILDFADRIARELGQANSELQPEMRGADGPSA